MMKYLNMIGWILVASLFLGLTMFAFAANAPAPAMSATSPITTSNTTDNSNTVDIDNTVNSITNASNATTANTPAPSATTKPTATTDNSGTAVQLPVPVGKVVWVKGSLKSVAPNQEERLLKKDSIIYLKDTLVTDEKTQAQIVFTDNTLMTFREGTTFFINQYSYTQNTKGKSAGKYVMDLIEGGFRTITGLIAKNNPDDYQVNTPVATIGVRGTDYAVYFRKGQMFVGYYEGKPCVTGSGDKKKDKTLCLDKDVKYAEVGDTGIPVPTNIQPAVFRETLQIVPTKITPFSAAQGTVTQTIAPVSTPSSGPINSFCIQ